MKFPAIADHSITTHYYIREILLLMFMEFVSCVTSTLFGSTSTEVCLKRAADFYTLPINGRDQIAFGAYARLVPDLVGSLGDGLDLADSITIDGKPRTSTGLIMNEHFPQHTNG